MTFDVNELPGRAQQLKDKGIEMFTKLGYARSALIKQQYEQSQQNGGAYNGGDYYGYGSGYFTEDQIDQAAAQAFAGVENLYDDWTGIPAPEDFVSQTDGLAKAMSALAVQAYQNDPTGKTGFYTPANTDLTGVSTSGDYLGGWTGDAAETYKANFADKFVPTTSSQFTLAASLRQAVNAEACIWQQVRQDLDKLSNDAISKMKECDDKSPSDWAAVLTVIGAVVSIAAVPATGGGSVALYFAIAGAGLGVAATGIGAIGSGPQPDEFGLEAGDPLKIIEGVRTALGKINGHVIDGENQIIEAANSTASNISAHGDELVLPKPDLADADNGHKYNDPVYAGQAK